jgi:CubicO group peptidase (beta-lactamase class C family)
MRWGSITKLFTALTVLALADHEQVSLQAPLQDYVDADKWQNPWRTTHPIRVIDLLEMRAGFPDLSIEEFDFNEPVSLSQALQLNPGHRKTVWPPGLQHAYSNMTLGLTQLLIEKVSGLAYPDAVHQYVLAPLSVEDVSFAPVPQLPGGYQADGVTPIAYWHMTFPAYGAMNAPLTALTSMLDYLRGVLPLPERARQHLFKPHGRRLATEFTFDYAAGLYPRVRAHRVWHTHGGDADGYRSRIAVLANTDRGYVVNINSDNPRALREIEDVLEHHLVADLSPLPTPATKPPARSTLLKFAGTYYPSATRFGLPQWQQGKAQAGYITVDGQNLIWRYKSNEQKLIGVSTHQFRRPGDPVATVVFIEQGPALYLQGELGHFVRTNAKNFNPADYFSATD